MTTSDHGWNTSDNGWTTSDHRLIACVAGGFKELRFYSEGNYGERNETPNPLEPPATQATTDGPRATTGDKDWFQTFRAEKWLLNRIHVK